ncbi:MAG TPA: 6-carboxytetrahydropterin synthase QueD [Candidatus Omnitrophota bacterium]|nr:6-carboxytetrahydropterin synthase QueD [Candidatus Omnitrophota bacterium]HPS19847.1 6-carboxytetrahydropterin synthase QueD [Candidatus Omnitrophota bacterium]
MYRIKIRSDFSGAHNLRGYKGKCEALHGHNWYVEVEAESTDLDEIGMVVDFGDLRRMLNDILSDLDHKYVNEHEYFKKVNPTSENIARYLFEEISRRNPKVRFTAVTVWETNNASATYSPDSGR